MKKNIFILLCVLSNKFLIYAQPSIQWQKTFGGSGNEYANSIIQTNDGGFIIAGASASNDSDVTGNNGLFDYWIVKINNTGLLQWQKTFGGSGDDYANCIQQTNDGGYIIAGYSESNDSDVVGNYGFRDFWIIKTDSSGSIDWQKNYGGSNFEIAYDIQQTTDGGYIVAGYSNSIDGDLAGTNNNAQNYWLLKLDFSGIIQWYNIYGGSFTDEALSVQQTSDQGFILTGYTYSQNGHVTNYHGNKDVWVVKSDSTGNIQWQKTLGGTASESSNCIRQTADGGFVVACSSTSNDDDITGNHGGADSWIVKLDSTGIIQWQKALGGSTSDGASSINQTTDGGYIVGGYSTSNDGDVTLNHGDYDCWIIKLNSSGTIEWQKSLGGTGVDEANVIFQTTDGGFIIAGTVSSNDGDVTGNHGNSDYWIVKLDSAQHVGVNEISKSYTDFQILPNPFSNETVFSFNCLLPDKYKIEIRDIEGRFIKNLMPENYSIGEFEIRWDGTNDVGKKVDDGLYFVTFVSGNMTESRKVMLMKN